MSGEPGFDPAALTATPLGAVTLSELLVQTNNNPKTLKVSIPWPFGGVYPTYFDVNETIDPGTMPQFGACTIEDERIKFEFNAAGFAGPDTRFKIPDVSYRGFDGSTPASHTVPLVGPSLNVYFNAIAWHHNKLLGELLQTREDINDIQDTIAAGATPEYFINTATGQIAGGSNQGGGSLTPATPTMTLGLANVVGPGIPGANYNAPIIDVDSFGRVVKVIPAANPVRSGDAAGFDISGSYPSSIMVVGLQGDSLPAPTAGDFLRRNATDTGWEWTAATNNTTTNNNWSGSNTFKDEANFQILESTDAVAPPDANTRRLQFDIVAASVPAGKIATIAVEHADDRTYTVTDNVTATKIPVFERRTVVTGTPTADQVIKFVSAVGLVDQAVWATSPAAGAPAGASYITFDNASPANDDLTNNRVLGFGNGIQFTGLPGLDDGPLTIAIQPVDSIDWTGTETFRDGIKFQVLNDTTPTKKAQFNLSGMAATRIASLAFLDTVQDHTYKFTDLAGTAANAFVPLHLAALYVSNTPTSGQVLTATGANAATWQAPSVSTLDIRDEGTTLTISPTSIDFVGAGVTATNISGAVTVTVPAGGTTGGNNTWTGANTFLDGANFQILHVADTSRRLQFELSNGNPSVVLTLRTAAPVTKTYDFTDHVTALWIPMFAAAMAVTNTPPAAGDVLTAVTTNTATWQTPASSGTSGGGWTWVVTGAASTAMVSGTSYVASGTAGTQTFSLPLGVPLGSSVKVMMRAAGVAPGAVLKVVPGASLGMKIIFGDAATTPVAGYIQSGANATSNVGSVLEIACVDSTPGAEIWMMQSDEGRYDVV